MKIYSKTGDGGETGLFGGGRVPKSHVRIDACGVLDELGAFLGYARSAVEVELVRDRLETVQHDLFGLGATMATPMPAEGRKRPETPPLPLHRVGEMETWIDEVVREVPPLENFVLSGGSPGAVAVDLARTVCRRAERAAVTLSLEADVDPGVIQYLNRLSDTLFAFARLENHRAGTGDVIWDQDGGR
ncbi:MAG: cob(I)yrinic acid a,c-diamide adenosyltransferase [Gemmatimonadota bacterium]|nr:MAG: cob(I)yrinic acid a,c-diamide adenosyltransferase [Gemmatimonadota bacterium]